MPFPIPDAKPAWLLRPSQFGLVVGAALFLAVLITPPPADLPLAGWRTLALALTMAIWWTTEALPVGVTALMPVIGLPLAGVSGLDAAAAPYANPLVFLFLGGFLLAAGVQRWGLHRRLAALALRAFGDSPRRLVLGIMAAGALLSMWISNTSAVVLMLPVVLSLIAAADRAWDGAPARRFARALLLGLAYAASIGGMGTLIGTPPNAMLAGYLREQYGIDLSFAAWLAVGLPLVVVFLPLAWLVLTRLLYPLGALAGAGRFDIDLASAGPMQSSERRVAFVFAAAAFLWIARPFLNRLPALEALSDAGIALACAAALFVLPSGERRPLLVWDEAKAIPWDVLILFGGGLSLAEAMDHSGLAAWLGAQLAGLGDLPPFVFLLLLCAVVVLVTELASNTATAAALLPVSAAIAEGAGMDVTVVAATVAMAASCGFMLPVATPPNALVFASGHLSAATMARAGLLMNLLAILLISCAVSLLAPLIAALG